MATDDDESNIRSLHDARVRRRDRLAALRSAMNAVSVLRLHLGRLPFDNVSPHREFAAALRVYEQALVMERDRLLDGR